MKSLSFDKTVCYINKKKRIYASHITNHFLLCRMYYLFAVCLFNCFTEIPVGIWMVTYTLSNPRMFTLRYILTGPVQPMGDHADWHVMIRPILIGQIVW